MKTVIFTSANQQSVNGISRLDANQGDQADEILNALNEPILQESQP